MSLSITPAEAKRDGLVAIADFVSPVEDEAAVQMMVEIKHRKPRFLKRRWSDGLDRITIYGERAPRITKMEQAKSAASLRSISNRKS